MLKKILAILFCVTVTAVFGAYFFFVSRLEAKEVPTLTCSRINVSIQDSLSKSFISISEIESMAADSVIGRRLDEIDTDALEKSLTKSGAISTAEAFTVYPDLVNIVVTQREPVLRLQTGTDDFYCDKSGFILPVTGARALNLPVVTGSFPMELRTGPTDDDPQAGWLSNLISFTERVRNNAYWSGEIEQIEVASDGNMTLYLKQRPFRILFGSATDLDDKFMKMGVFYKTILPTEEGAGYKEINIKYKNQIICR